MQVYHRTTKSQGKKKVGQYETGPHYIITFSLNRGSMAKEKARKAAKKKTASKREMNEIAYRVVKQVTE
jgi:hypothetical protein